MLHSRQGRGGRIRRRRECKVCQKRFTTYEQVDLELPQVVKRSDRRREAFSEEKLRQGIALALRKRPIPQEQVDAMVEELLAWLRAYTEKEIESQRLGREVMDHLRRLDGVAYVRFASVYRNFDDVEEFKREVNELDNTLSPSQDQLRLPLSSRTEDP